jgi:hypothetical protein
MCRRAAQRQNGIRFLRFAAVINLGLGGLRSRSG